MEFLHAWPLSAWLTVLPLAGSALWKPACLLARLLRGREADAANREKSEIERLTTRVGDLEELVDLLRKALDKHLIRESAIASAAELLIAIVRMVPEPSGAMLHIRDRAQRVLEDARAHISSINREPRP